MDFLWVSDIPNTRKLNKSTCLPTNDNINTPNNENNILNRENLTAAVEQRSNNDISRLSFPPSTRTNPSEFTPTTTTATSSSRRSRADTMPTATLSPFFSSMGNYKSISNVAQQRPNHNNSRTETLVTPMEAMYHSSDMSSPLDENATNSIASTLASLGLNEDDNHHHHHQTRNKTSYFEHAPITRHRSFTVSSQMIENQQQQNNRDMMSFNLFSPSSSQPTSVADPSPVMNESNNAMRRRPRAISLGIADTQQLHQQFSPFEHHGDTNVDLTDTLPFQTPRTLFTHMDDEDNQTDDMEPPAQTPSRALWLGNVNPSVSVPDLHKLFAPYGHVESARILSDKECAFVNFETTESALAAKEDLVHRLGSKVGGTVVKVGFGKADVNTAMALTNEAGPNAQGPTRALWVGNIPANINPALLRSLFQSYGTIESIRILSHKNCGFVNFERQEDAVRARKMLQNKEILGAGTGTVRIGFAKAPANNPDEVVQDIVISGNTITSYPAPTNKSQPPPPPAAANVQQELLKPVSDTTSSNTNQWATVLLIASMMMNATSTQQQKTVPVHIPSNFQRSAAERRSIMQQLGYEPTSMDEVERIPIKYLSTIPPVLEFSAERKLGPLRLREIRKTLDNGNAIPNVEQIAQECMTEVVELCSDYIGNTVAQKLFEYCCEDTKLAMIKRIAPHLASIGVHKNGTWAAQKIIETARTDEQIQLICLSIAPYVPLLLLDQFGNYVVQCCLRMGPKRNQYIFDAIVDNCWEIGQGRFGARAVRAMLESPIVTKEQQIYVAAAIMQNALLLTTNVNGSILLNWLLESSGLLAQFKTSNLPHFT